MDGEGELYQFWIVQVCISMAVMALPTGASCHVSPSPFCLASPHFCLLQFYSVIFIFKSQCPHEPASLYPAVGFSQITFGGYESRSIWSILRDLGFSAHFSLTKSRRALERWAKFKVMSRGMLSIALEGKEKEVVQTYGWQFLAGLNCRSLVISLLINHPWLI